MGNLVDFKVEIQGSKRRFDVERFTVMEELSAPFRIELNLISSDADITFEELSRKPALLTLLGQGSGVSKQFHGTVSEVCYWGPIHDKSRYHVTLVPDFWFLSQRQDCRIFQQKSVEDIIKQVFADARFTGYKFSPNVVGKTPTKLYVLQYRESDESFVARLMAEHGLWYYFDHSESGHMMVIANSKDAVTDIPCTTDNATVVGSVVFHQPGNGNADREHVMKLRSAHSVNTGKVTFSDYNYNMPNTDLEVESAADQKNSDLAYYDYPGRYVDAEHGKTRVAEKREEYVVASHQVRGMSNVMRLATGHSFALQAHPRQALNSDYTLMSVKHEGQNPLVAGHEVSGHPDDSAHHATSYHNQFICIPKTTEFKPKKLPAPVVDGPQTAVVVGPAGEEIYTDKMGRIKVQFHWDRYAQKDENASCWIRVSQSMAGNNWGAVHLPRIGHEVVVTFLEGDTDRPLVTGVVYNGQNGPAYELPKNKTMTVFRTQTHKGEGYNELSFEDKKDAEEIYIHAQRDMVTKVLNDRHHTIDRDEYLAVTGNREKEVTGNQKETIHDFKQTQVDKTFTETVEKDVAVTYNADETHKVAHNQTVDVGDNRDVTVHKKDTLTVNDTRTVHVTKQQSTTIDADNSMTVGGQMTVTVKGGDTSISTDAGKTSITSSSAITLTTGSASLEMKSDGTINLKGSAINLTASGNLTLKGANVLQNP
ncbi:type VI secretion system tip protein VgrG [Vibrio profundum]|uniref:type VI secretion system Vgr family protein n=1 Tax=Vibrio profundum TaxID=2910247 RepID=UPI003D0F3CAF